MVVPLHRFAFVAPLHHRSRGDQTARAVRVGNRRRKIRFVAVKPHAVTPPQLDHTRARTYMRAQCACMRCGKAACGHPTATRHA